MKLFKHQASRSLFALTMTFSLISAAMLTQRVATQDKKPAPAGHVSDMAAALDDASKQELENLLTNLQQRGGINMTVVTVKTTGGRDIFDFSRDLARDWDIGAYGS